MLKIRDSEPNDLDHVLHHVFWGEHFENFMVEPINEIFLTGDFQYIYKI